jgi:hypothetical protein
MVYSRNFSILGQQLGILNLGCIFPEFYLFRYSLIFVFLALCFFFFGVSIHDRLHFVIFELTVASMEFGIAKRKDMETAAARLAKLMALRQMLTGDRIFMCTVF